MNVALSRRGAWLLRSFFAVVVVFLYAPIAILVLFSFNDSQLPSFPLSGFTLHWYHQFLVNPDLRSALETSAVVAALSSVGAVLLGVLASIALVRRRFRLKSPVSALLLSPLVIPYVVFGISLLLFFHAAGIPRSILTVVIGHIVISLPYTILVLMPRLQQIDVSLEEAAYDLGASRPRAFRSVTLPLLLPAVVSAYLIAFTTSFDEYAVASFVVGTRSTFPIFLYSALRFPNQLPQVIAVAVVVISVSLVVVIGAEVGRRVAERRVGETSAASSGCHSSTTSVPTSRSASGSSAIRCDTTRPARVSTWNCVYMPRKTTSAIRPRRKEPPSGEAAPAGDSCTCSGRVATRSGSPTRIPGPAVTTTRSPSSSRVTA